MKVLIENDSRRLKQVSRELIEHLKAKGVHEDIVFDIHVGFEEALRNAMVHGNRNDPSKSVRVETKIEDNAVVISVEDEGEGFDPSVVPDPTLEENLLKEGGRGVYLMNHLMDEIRYENGGRKVIMTKYFDRKHL
ncbi:MAG: ATP-binding protein [Candidatus Omnitrophica bacterium]|nr:ATP-binding protein [Candidatus Omnitrophota bacterium]